MTVYKFCIIKGSNLHTSGVYLISLCTMDAFYQGIYCQESVKWLKSSLCTVLGVLVVLASQLSVLTLASLAAARLISVINVSENHRRSILSFFISFKALARLTYMTLQVIRRSTSG